MRAWYLTCVAVLAGLPPSRCSKLPSWRGPNSFFDGTMPSNREGHGFAEVDGRIYVFGGAAVSGETLRAEEGAANMRRRLLAPPAARYARAEAYCEIVSRAELAS